MKRIGVLLACVGALAFPSASLAGNGGAGPEAHLARATALVAKYSEKCNVAHPAAKCADRNARLTAKLGAWDAKIQAKIAKLNQRPGGAAKSARLSQLQGVHTRIAALQAQL